MVPTRRRTSPSFTESGRGLGMRASWRARPPRLPVLRSRGASARRNRLAANGGYSRVDAQMRMRITRLLEAFVVGENVFDERYQEVLGYPALGRSVRAGLRLRTGGRR